MAWDIKGALRRYDGAVEDLLDATSELMTGEMVKAATYFRAVVTGNYRSSFRWRKIGKGKRRIFNPVSYAIFIELGTRFMAARPVMRLGLLNSKNVLRKIGINLS